MFRQPSQQNTFGPLNLMISSKDNLFANKVSGESRRLPIHKHLSGDSLDYLNNKGVFYINFL